MRTQLSRFCQHFDSIVRPLLAPLRETVKALEQAARDLPGAGLRDPLTETLHQLETLADKVSDQQAYVLIFGPLKSGKSTLMNAIAAAYVSEVGSLPAYPCLVFVSHGPRREYLVTSYDGTSERFLRTDVLHRRIQQAHAALADAMRETEASGEEFEPSQHLPGAIRRVDVRVPTKKLQASGAVLVDTPGLYTRMRFGYDRMTREFRNAAACAVFVVKSDTLFLEQVFDEFQQLLELFSRIFLVINMDTAKRDVGPDGRLLPSLEQSSPETIIEAFESLAMTAPLKQAAEEGRVQLYPVDLMNAASTALRKEGGARKLPPSFVRFRDDLDAYLASADYLAAFLGDSLRRAHLLGGECEALTGGAEAARLREEVERIDARLAICREELDRIASCLATELEPSFARFTKQVEYEIERRARDQAARVGRLMGAAIDTWFLSSHGLAHLTDREWGPLVRELRESVHQVALERLEQSNGQVDAGLDLELRLSEALEEFGIDLRDVRRKAYASLGPPPDPQGSVVPIAWEAIPIRRGMLDVVRLRPVETVRLNVLGPPDDLAPKIPARIKASRLGEPAKQYIQQRVLQFRHEIQASTANDMLARFRDDLQRATIAELHRRLSARQPTLVAEVERLERDGAAHRQLLGPFDALRAKAAAVVSKVTDLSTEYASIDPEELFAANVPEPDVVIEPAPPPEQEAEADEPREPERRSWRRRRREQESG